MHKNPKAVEYITGKNKLDEQFKSFIEDNDTKS